jgi:glycosyltransferase involved in cell wall biosynthesis
MQCGTPTITSNQTCFPEVVGEAGLMIDTLDEKVMASAMMRLISDERLRKELRAKGFKQAALFDWRKTAALTLAIYERVHALKYGNRRAE